MKLLNTSANNTTNLLVDQLISGIILTQDVTDEFVTLENFKLVVQTQIKYDHYNELAVYVYVCMIV